MTPHPLRRILPAVVTAVVVVAAGCSRSAPRRAAPRAPLLEEQTSGVTAVLQAVSAVDEDVVWVTGHAAVVLRSTDGGATWQRRAVPNAESDSLQFRDVAAFSATDAYILAAGPGARSRIFRTRDGGATWAEQFANTDPDAFYDCFAFFGPDAGVVVSDAVQGTLIVRTTLDGGARWDRVPEGGVPAALEGEGAFAASGTCLVSVGARHAWIGSAGAAGSRVYRSGDRGRSWSFEDVPLVAGPASGVAALAFRDTLNGVALGGRIAVASDTNNHVAVTRDGGQTWLRAGRPPFAGAVFGAHYVPGSGAPLLVAAGPGGLALSRDDGATWSGLSSNGYWAVGFASPTAGWAVGPRGRITRVRL
jgi:photosystem II stability/assembly factor-like uncharacterized protein